MNVEGREKRERAGRENARARDNASGEHSGTLSVVVGLLTVEVAFTQRACGGGIIRMVFLEK